MVALCAAVSAVLWIVYGARFGAPALDNANTLVLVGIGAVSVVYVRRRIWRLRDVLVAALCLRLIALLAASTVQSALGFAATVVSVLLWLPAAVSGMGDVWLWLAAPAVVVCAVLAQWSVGVMSRVTPLTQTD